MEFENVFYVKEENVLKTFSMLKVEHFLFARHTSLQRTSISQYDSALL